ncbi:MULTISPECIES: TorD/DmsD family molecular chaperone [unclassified Luteococcus]|uniref:TorD/DmsD family molecular chaperone n=1 Tax=unclassified Luteococcus TaxID=2639923 RepID=UPI00313C9D84
MRPWQELAAAGAVLRVLSAVMSGPPSPELLAMVRQREWQQQWPMAHTGVCLAGLDHLAASAEVGEDLGDITADHARLMGGPGRVAVHPYESVHRSVEGLLFEQETLEVRAAYAEFGLAAPHKNRAPDDHIALELEFVATLAERAVDSEPPEQDTLVAGFERFLAEHLFRWGPNFFDRLGQAAQTDFYRGVALLGVDTLVQVGAGQQES